MKIKSFEEFVTESEANEGFGKTVGGILLGTALALSPKIRAQTVASSEDQIAYATHAYFSKEKEVRSALVKCDLSKFFKDDVTMTLDGKDKVVNLSKLNQALKKFMPAGCNLKKASETNNGYTLSFGAYKGDDALAYITVVFNSDGVLTDIMLEEND